jgi:uncharacterized protein YqeY
MNLAEQLQNDLKDAMRAGDTTRRDTLRLALAAARNARIAAGKELDDSDMLAVLTKEAKQRQESIEEFRKGGRQDLVDKESAELGVLQGYLPEQLSREDVEAAARKVVGETRASGMKDIGKVMPPLMKELRGRADGKVVNEVVRELLG